MEQNPIAATELTQTISAPVQTEVSEKTAQIKRVYNRAGLGLLAEIGIFQQIGSVVLVFAAVLCALVALLPRIKNSDFNFRGIEDIFTALKSSGAIGWAVLAYALGMSIGMTVGLIVMRKILTEKAPIEKKNLTLGQFLLIVMAAYGLWGLGVILGNFPSFFGVEEESTIEQLLEGLKYERIPLYVYTVIGAPVFEELVCRKFLLDRLNPYGEGYAVAVTGLLFGLIHGNSQQFFLAVLLGALFAVVYLRTGRIIYTMILHCIINLTATFPEILKMFDIDIEAGFMIGILVLSFIGWIVILAARKHLPAMPKGTGVTGATRAVWKNVGMMVARIVWLVSLVSTDLMLMVMSIISSQSALPLLRLIPCGLAILTVLLLPKWTTRYERKFLSDDFAAEMEPAE